MTIQRSIFPLRALVAAALVVVTAGCGDDGQTAPARAVASVRVTPVQRELTVGQTVTLSATPLASDGSELSGYAVTWRSDATEVATVSAQGVVEARQVGMATIVAASGSKEGRATITIVVTPVASVQLDAADVPLTEYATRQVAATSRDAAGNALPGRAVVWATEHPTVATVSGTGLVTAVGVGTTRLIATSGGVSAAVPVTVSPAAVASIEIDVGTLELVEGATRRLVATARDAGGRVLSGRTVRWLTTDSSVALVDASGAVTALRWGSAVISARVDGGVGSSRLTVASPLAFDLMYDARTGFQNQPQLYRLDVRSPGATPVRVLDAAGAKEVTPSPDGLRIAFTATTGDGTEIYVANRDGSGMRAVTSGTSHADQPAWSPDGARIAFRRWPAGGPPGPFNAADIWVTNADGTGQVNLTADAGDAASMASPTWSPRQADGSYRIAYSRQLLADGYLRGSIQTMRADGTDKRAITAVGAQFDVDPAWSPDGQTIVFVRTGGEAMGDLWVVPVAGGAARQLMARDPAFEQRSPTWSPDGRFIAFTSNHELGTNNRWDYQIYTVSADGSGVVRRTEGVEKEHPAWIAQP